MSEAILQGLTTIASDWRGLAVVWHAGAALLLVVLVLRAATQQLVAAALTLPLFSVASLAWWAGNPFNGAVFGVIGVALLLLATCLPHVPVAFAGRWQVAAGAALCAFAWVYPHFVEGPWWLSLYQSPLGLIPCPTLSFVVGVALMTNSLQSSAWRLIAASVSVLYGLTGVFVLGVGIDWVLVAGGALLAADIVGRFRRAPDLVVVRGFGGRYEQSSQ